MASRSKPKSLRDPSDLPEEGRAASVIDFLGSYYAGE